MGVTTCGMSRCVREILHTSEPLASAPHNMVLGFHKMLSSKNSINLNLALSVSHCDNCPSPSTLFFCVTG